MVWPVLPSSSGSWPAARRGRCWPSPARHRRLVTAQWLLFQPGTDGARAYLGTDTRAASILVGCGAAILLWTRSHRVAPVVWHWLHLLAPLVAGRASSPPGSSAGPGRGCTAAGSPCSPWPRP